MKKFFLIFSFFVVIILLLFFDYSCYLRLLNINLEFFFISDEKLVIFTLEYFLNKEFTLTTLLEFLVLSFLRIFFFIYYQFNVLLFKLPYYIFLPDNFIWKFIKMNEKDFFVEVHLSINLWFNYWFENFLYYFVNFFCFFFFYMLSEYDLRFWGDYYEDEEDIELNDLFPAKNAHSLQTSINDEDISLALGSELFFEPDVVTYLRAERVDIAEESENLEFALDTISSVELPEDLNFLEMYLNFLTSFFFTKIYNFLPATLINFLGFKDTEFFLKKILVIIFYFPFLFIIVFKKLIFLLKNVIRK